MATAYEIYQTYLRGPVAVIRLFEQAPGTQAIYGTPDPDMQHASSRACQEDVGRLQRKVARLKEELREMRGDDHRLRRRNTKLEALISKDSHNSSHLRPTYRGASALSPLITIRRSVTCAW